MVPPNAPMKSVFQLKASGMEKLKKLQKLLNGKSGLPLDEEGKCTGCPIHLYWWRENSHQSDVLLIIDGNKIRSHNRAVVLFWQNNSRRELVKYRVCVRQEQQMQLLSILQQFDSFLELMANDVEIRMLKARSLISD